MKPLFSFPIFFLLIFFYNVSVAQKHRIPRWISDNGSWVVESNIHRPAEAIVYFYNNAGVNIYKEKIEGIKLDVSKRNVKMKLKKVLHSALLAWNENKRMYENKNWVAILFK